MFSRYNDLIEITEIPDELLCAEDMDFISGLELKLIGKGQVQVTIEMNRYDDGLFNNVKILKCLMSDSLVIQYTNYLLGIK
jgi:hypothetical protein